MATAKIASLREHLLSAKRIGLDTMCFIYQFADHPSYGELTNIVFTLMEEKRITAVTSVVSVIETLVEPEKKHAYDTIAEYEKIFEHYPNLEVIPLNWYVARLTAKLKATYPVLRLPDAAQLAVALLSGSHAFLTNDKKLTQVKEIPIILLSAYI